MNSLNQYYSCSEKNMELESDWWGGGFQYTLAVVSQIMLMMEGFWMQTPMSLSTSIGYLKVLDSF